MENRIIGLRLPAQESSLITDPDASITELGMTVVAEGSSSREIWDALHGFGCDEAQGYYVAKPFPATEFGAWLQSAGRRVRPQQGGGSRHH
jgi:EAL domain-containing protein (putative c-di-GMP-specific phosphodiesterase class I)